MALDPATGRPIESFGEKGSLHVNPGSPASLANARGPVVPGPASDAPSDVPARGRGRGAGAGPEAVGGGPAGRGGFGNGFSLSSPPAIYKNLVILGGSEGEGSVIGPSGDPQAFDIKTGKLAWRFHTVPQPGEPGHNTWGEGWKDRFLERLFHYRESIDSNSATGACVCRRPGQTTGAEYEG